MPANSADDVIPFWLKKTFLFVEDHAVAQYTLLEALNKIDFAEVLYYVLRASMQNIMMTNYLHVPVTSAAL